MNRKYLTKKILAAATVTVMMFGTVPCQSVWAEEAPEIDGLTFESEMPLEYAQKFKIYNYSDDYRLLDINDGTQYLVVPEGKEAPENLDSDITVLQMPLDRVYLTATSVMSLYDSLDAIDQIRLSGTQANGWYIDDAVSAMEAGDILFA
ncbi:MAG: ABC transporter substrate-binding protein, partial [Blautia sp.]|nr:ABC transporter substrate-binding protein [Blautia sp.]